MNQKSHFDIEQFLLFAPGLLHHLRQIDILTDRVAHHRFRLKIQDLRGLRIEVRNNTAGIAHHQSVADGLQGGGHLGPLGVQLDEETFILHLAFDRTCRGVNHGQRMHIAAAHQPDHANNPDRMSKCIENRRSGRRQRMKAQEEMLGADDLHGAAFQQRQTKGIGAGVFLAPVGPGKQAQRRQMIDNLGIAQHLQHAGRGIQ